MQNDRQAYSTGASIHWSLFRVCEMKTSASAEMYKVKETIISLITRKFHWSLPSGKFGRVTSRIQKY